MRLSNSVLVFVLTLSSIPVLWGELWCNQSVLGFHTDRRSATCGFPLMGKWPDRYILLDQLLQTYLIPSASDIVLGAFYDPCWLCVLILKKKKKSFVIILVRFQNRCEAFDFNPPYFNCKWSVVYELFMLVHHLKHSKDSRCMHWKIKFTHLSTVCKVLQNQGPVWFSNCCPSISLISRHSDRSATPWIQLTTLPLPIIQQILWY